MASEIDELTAQLQNYVVAPLNAFGLGGYVFDIEGEGTTTLSAEITDHYTEDNKAVQDHIARKPKNVTLRGYVGEVVNRPAGTGVAGVLQTVTQKLTEVSAFLPVLSTAVDQAQAISMNSTVGFNEGLSDAADIYGLVQNVIGATGDMANQQKAYLYFCACWQQGVLMGIQTPFEFLTNMAIENVVAIQEEGSTSMSDFSVRYKQMRFASTSSQAYSPTPSSQTSTTNPSTTDPISGITPVPASQLQGDAALQAPNPVSIGPVPGVSLPSSTLPGAQAGISVVDDLSPLANQAALSAYRTANGLPTPPIDNYYNGLSKIFVRAGAIP